nr:MAG: hypothetical protein [Bacteriophage sp.]
MRYNFMSIGIGVGSDISGMREVLPIGQGIKQNMIISEIGSVKEIRVTAVVFSPGGTAVQSVQRALIKNVYENMVVDLSAFAPLFGDDVCTTELLCGNGDGQDRRYFLFMQPDVGGLGTIPVYPLGSVRIGSNGGEGAFADYNYAQQGELPDAWDANANVALPAREAVKDLHIGIDGLLGATRVRRISPDSDGYICDLRPAIDYPWVKHNMYASMMFMNDGTQVVRVTLPKYEGGTPTEWVVKPKETRILSAPFDHTGRRVIFRVFGPQGLQVRFRASRIMVTRGNCYRPYTRSYQEQSAHRDDMSAYIGYLTDYKDGYFNRLEDVGDDGKAQGVSASVQMSAQGFPFANRLFFPYGFLGSTPSAEMAYFKTINEHGDIPSDGTKPTVINSGWVPNVSDFNETFATRSYVWLNPEDGTFVPYGTERYRKKEFHDLPIEKKVALKWLNSRGAFDSMYFADYTLTPQLSVTGELESLDVVVKKVITEDNEDALFYLTRSPHILALTPFDVVQWGEAKSESNGVFATRGGNVGKTLTLKFSVTLNRA